MTSSNLVSVVIPVSERVEDLPSLVHRYREALEGDGKQVEIICVLDGSFKALSAELQDIQKERGNLKIVQLARHFGEATALRAGFDLAKGDIVMTLPAYEQVTADSLPVLLSALPDKPMAIGVRSPRQDGWLNKLQARVFNGLVSAFTGEKFRDLGCGVRAIRRDVLEHIQLYGDLHRFLPILASRAGFGVVEMELQQSSQDHRRRLYSVGIYVRRMLDLLTVLFLVKFTKKPLRFFGLLGTGFSAFGGLVLSYLIVERLLGLTTLSERPAFLLGAIMLVLGIQLFAIGLLGELIIFTHAKEIKEYSIEEITN